VNGGAAVTFGDAVDPGGASWGSQGMIAFSPTAVGVLQQVPDAGGTPQPLTRLEKGDVSQRWPEFLPGGKAVLFAAGGSGVDFTSAKVAVQSVGTGERRNLIQTGTYPRYALSRHLVYAQGGSLMAVPFDPQRLAVTGSAISVVEGVMPSPSGASQYGFSATGSLSGSAAMGGASRCRRCARLPEPAALSRRPACGRYDRRIWEPDLALRSGPGDADPVYV
jgi:hypothetical protein